MNLKNDSIIKTHEPICGKIILILSLAALFGCSSDDRGSASASSAATPVILQAVELRPEQVRMEAVGTSRALRSVTLFADTPGEVVSVQFQTGDPVKADQALIKLDDRDQRLAVKLARVRLADAQQLYQRYLNTRNSSGISPTIIDAARLAVESADIELEKALLALEKRTVKAPFDGFIGITDIDPGDRIGTDMPIATLDDRHALLVTFEVPELLIGRLAVSDTVSLAAWNNKDLAINGKIVDIDSRIDPVKRTFVARARVLNDQDQLRPGMSFRVKLELNGHLYPALPHVSVQWGGEGAYIWVTDDGKARRVLVNIVQRQQDKILVDANLTAGVQVVVEGVQRMREGVEIAAWQDPALPTSTPQENHQQEENHQQVPESSTSK